jgi:hypothetical protein
MGLDDPTERALGDLLDAEVQFIVVGGLAAVLMGAPVVTFDPRYRPPPDAGERRPPPRPAPSAWRVPPARPGEPAPAADARGAARPRPSQFRDARCQARRAVRDRGAVGIPGDPRRHRVRSFFAARCSVSSAFDGSSRRKPQPVVRRTTWSFPSWSPHSRQAKSANDITRRALIN